MFKKIKDFFTRYFRHKEKETAPTPIVMKPLIDWGFIDSLEGSRRKGYVPLSRGRPVGQSGITVGKGFDLGHHRKSYLENIGLSDSLIKKLLPYLGLRKWEAYNFILRNPLELTKEEETELNEAVKKEKTRELKNLYKGFFNLDSAKQTVLMSVYWQYGHLPTRTPKFWKFYTEKNWEKVIEELENFGDDFKTRRNKEAQYLKTKSREVEKLFIYK